MEVSIAGKHRVSTSISRWMKFAENELLAVPYHDDLKSRQWHLCEHQGHFSFFFGGLFFQKRGGGKGS